MDVARKALYGLSQAKCEWVLSTAFSRLPSILIVVPLLQYIIMFIVCILTSPL